MKTIDFSVLNAAISAYPQRKLELQQAGITCAAELALFTAEMLTGITQLSTSMIIWIEDILHDSGIALRDRNEKFTDALVRLFGSVDDAPIEVLNFIVEGKYVSFAPLIQLMKFAPNRFDNLRSFRQGNEQNLDKHVTDDLFEAFSRADMLEAA